MTYQDLLKSIEALFGDGILDRIENIFSVFARDQTLRLPIKTDDDLEKVLEISRANGTSKLNILLTVKRDQEEDRTDSPPPGVLPQQKRRPPSQTTVSTDGGRFIPEKVREKHGKCSRKSVFVFLIP